MSNGLRCCDSVSLNWDTDTPTTSTSDDTFDDGDDMSASAQNHGDNQDVHKMSRQIRLKTWRGLAGPHLDRMMAGPHQAMEYLSSEKPDLRVAAIGVLTSHFGLTRRIQPRLEATAETDEDPGVRICAAMALAAYYVSMHDPRGKGILARLVRDESQSDSFRVACYGQLWVMDGRPLEASLVLRHESGDFRFPEDIDWGLVDRMASDAGGVGRDPGD